MGRRMQWPDKIIAALPAGTLERMTAVLGPGETKTDFLRNAVLPALVAREAAAAPVLEVPVDPSGATEAESQTISRSFQLGLDNPSYWLPRPPSRLELERAARLATVRGKVSKMGKLPPCCRSYCGSRSSWICIETEEKFCSDHRRDAIWPMAIADL